MNDKLEIFYTSNLKAATAIHAFGFERTALSKTLRQDGKESVVFTFNPRNAEGHRAAQICHWMTAGNEETIGAEEALLATLNDKQRALFYKAVCRYLYAYAHSRDALVTDIHNTIRKVEIVNGTRRAAISENASDEKKRQIASML